MLRLLIFTLFIVCCKSVSAQYYLGKNRSQVKAGLLAYAKTTNVQLQSEETDSTLSFHLRDEKFLPADFIYSFDTDGNCVIEKRIACDSCVRKYLQEALDKKKYDWKKIRDNVFVSKYRWQLLMQVLIENNQHILLIQKISFTRQEYQNLVTPPARKSTRR